MRPIHLLPLLAAASQANALAVKEDDLSVGLTAQLQLRANLINDATTASGDTYDPIRGTPGEAERVRYVVRRAMLGLNPKYGEHFSGVFQVRGAENTARTGTGTTDPVAVWFAFAQASWEGGPLRHIIRLGLDKAFNTESTISSAEYLFPTDRPIAATAVYRSVGAAYRLNGPWFAFGFDQRNNSTAAKDTQAGNGLGAEPANGCYWSTRLEISPGKDWWIKRRTESFLGRAGSEALLGFDLGYDDHNLSDNAAATTFKSTSALTWGPDLLVHWEKLSLLAEVRWTRTVGRTVVDASQATTETTMCGMTANLQAGWAIPLSDILLEPCLRLSRIDGNRDDGDELSVYGNNENGGSGRQGDAGINCYWFYKGHNLKTQLALSRWQAEAGEGDATILRLQQQLAF